MFTGKKRLPLSISLFAFLFVGSSGIRNITFGMMPWVITRTFSGMPKMLERGKIAATPFGMTAPPSVFI